MPDAPARFARSAPPSRIINAAAPIRVCDNGGWTDTWFAGHGQVFNIAVSPCVEVQVAVHGRDELADRVVLHAANYGERYAFAPGPSRPDRHPLLEAAVTEIGVPDDLSVEITIFSEVPAGCSTGTSASVTVALLAALDQLTPGRMTPHELAGTAHRVEVERLGWQSGIQDQLCAAYGGVNFIEMFEYPRASVSRLAVPDAVWWELERRLVLVFLGRTHASSAVHEKVIARFEREGARSADLDRLRHMAERARDAVQAANFVALGSAMSDNTAAQRDIHPDLVSDAANEVIDVARAHGALGWKVNGAGGEGGSLTLLCGPDMGDQRRLLQAIPERDPRFQVIPTHLSRSGVRVWEH